jgi:GntR family carbon starvation induced transcriptional regulator
MTSIPAGEGESSVPPTRAGWADRRLRHAILSGELAPGDRLVVGALAARWKVSPTPLREACSRLAADGLVEIRPQRGARVAPVSAADAEEIYELRLRLEPWALRQSLERSDGAHRAGIAAAYERFVHPDGPRTLLETVDAHRDFHAALLERCPSRWLLRFAALLADHSQRYQLLSLGQRDGHHDVAAEHGALRDAALTGDVDAAVAHLEAHLRRTLEGVKSALGAPRSAFVASAGGS